MSKKRKAVSEKMGTPKIKGTQKQKSSTSKNTYFVNGKIDRKEESLSIKSINVLVQTSTRFDENEIIDLAKSIAQIGLLHPIGVASFDKKACEGYLSLINRNRGTEYSIKKLKKYKGRYLVLIYGEKRFRSLKCIFENVVGKYNPQYFPQKKVRTQVYKNLTLWGFLTMQCSENTYNKPGPEELAEFYFAFYKEFRELEGPGELTMTKFAKTMGVSINTMSAALKFADLPESIKAYANTRAFFNYKKSTKQGKSSNQNNEVRDLLSYGILCQISRLHQAGEDEFSLIQWCIRCLVKNYTVEEFKKIVQELLKRKDNASLFDENYNEFTIAQKKESIKANCKFEIDRKVRIAVYAEIQYLNKIIDLFNDDLVGKDESPFSSDGILKMIKKQVDLLNEKILPHIQSLKDDQYFKDSLKKVGATNIVAEIEKTSEVFEKILTTNKE